MEDESFLDYASDRAFDEFKRVDNDLKKLSVPLQTVVLIYAAQGVIDSGGFEYFFENDWPSQPQYNEFVEAYRRIGATAAADRLEKAVALFPFIDPHLHEKLRREFLKALPEESELSTLGEALCGDEAIWQLLHNYAEKHVEFFKIN